MRNRENVEKVGESGLRSLLIQTAQVGLGFGVMLVITGGRPSPTVISLTVAGGIVFVAVTEERRLTVEHKLLVEKHRQELEKED